jgi:hypothetical protein
LQRGGAQEGLLGQVAAPGTLPPTPHVGHGGCVGRRQPPGGQGGHGHAARRKVQHTAKSSMCEESLGEESLIDRTWVRIWAKYLTVSRWRARRLRWLLLHRQAPNHWLCRTAAAQVRV